MTTMNILMKCCEVFKETQALDGPATLHFGSLLELFRLAPSHGDVVELGVAFGGSFRFWGHLIAHHRQETARLFGLDTFSGFPPLSSEDGPEIPSIGKQAGKNVEMGTLPIDAVAAKTYVTSQADEWGGRCDWRLVPGRVEDTAEAIASCCAPSLVFFDADLYSPTKAGLDAFWPRLLPGGLFVFDEYGFDEWPGETKAVDDFVLKHGIGSLLIRRPRASFVPSAYLRKGLS